MANKADDISDEAKELVQTDKDLYELLGVEPTATAQDIKRAFRKFSLKHHPDKNPDNPAAVETFHIGTRAVELLAHATYRAQYDATREARKQKAAHAAKLDSRRRQMMQELEKAERGAKRKREDEHNEAVKIRRLAEDGARRRKEREEQKAREREEEERAARERAHARAHAQAQAHTNAQAGFRASTTRVPDGEADGTAPGAAAATPTKPAGRFSGLQSAPSTPAGRFKPPAFSFSPKTPQGEPPKSGGGGSFEESTLARLKARQAEKRRLEAEAEAEAAKAKA